MWRATLNSWRGMIAAARSEQAFREELVALAIAVPLAFLIAADAWKRLTLIGVILLLMAVELLNTAIEKLSDHVTPAQHPDRQPPLPHHRPAPSVTEMAWSSGKLVAARRCRFC